MGDKYDPLKRVKVSESKGLGGASPGQVFKMKEKQLWIPGLKVEKASRLKKLKKATNSVNA